MNIQYVGPFDSVELAGVGVILRGDVLSVSAELAGKEPSPRLAEAQAELAEAVAAIDHDRAAALRAEIVELDHGHGLLAQTDNWRRLKRGDEPVDLTTPPAADGGDNPDGGTQ